VSDFAEQSYSAVAATETDHATFHPVVSSAHIESHAFAAICSCWGLLLEQQQMRWRWGGNDVQSYFPLCRSSFLK
jgi:hypothetical protein